MNFTIMRPNTMMSFGFALASLWTIDGRFVAHLACCDVSIATLFCFLKIRRNVISWVDPAGPASTAVQLEDEIIEVNGENVSQLSLDELKAVVRRAGERRDSCT
jgi:hypothetical protein